MPKHVDWKRQMIAVDFFCGAGGLTRGLLDAGIEVVAGIDIDEKCRQTYEYNNYPSKFIAEDLRTLDIDRIRALLPDVSNTPVLFAGCAPCQSFSTQRKSKARRPDATILINFAKIIECMRPDFVLVENVPGITKVPGFSAYRRFKNSLKSCGYQFSEAIVDAKDFGVPQSRRRFVFVAGLKTKPTLPVEVFGKGDRAYATVREAISHFPSLCAGASHPRVPNHIAATISKVNLIRLQHTPWDGGDRRSWPDKLVLDCHRGSYKGHTDVYGRLKWDAPAPTLTGKCHSISNGRYGHPEQDRAISLREAASLQSFDDNYEFFGTVRHIAQQIGNAVPVRLAQCLGSELLSSASRK